MSVRAHQRVLIAAAVALLLLLAAATAVSATPASPIQKGEYTAAGSQPSGFGPFVITPFVYVATGENFPDALGAGPAAGAARGPVLLVSKNSIPDATKAELGRLQPNEIFVVGGTAVISQAVEALLAPYAPKVTRLAGANRYETAANVSKSAFPVPSTFVVANTSDASTLINGTCTAYADLVVPVTAPGPGTIVVTANVNLSTWHEHTTTDFTQLWIGTSPTDCTEESGYGGDTTYVQTDGTLPTGFVFPWVSMRKIIHVENAGTTTLYVTGIDAGPTYYSNFFYGYMDAMYIPDPGA